MGVLSSRAKAEKPYVHQPFPSVRYHRSGATKIVNSEAEHNALLDEDEDWADTPAAFDEPKPAKAKKKADAAKAEPAKTEPGEPAKS